MQYRAESMSVRINIQKKQIKLKFFAHNLQPFENVSVLYIIENKKQFIKQSHENT